MVVLRSTLRLLAKREFSTVTSYDGPDVTLPGSGSGIVPTEDVVHALEDVEGETPPFMGWKCVLAHDREDDARAKLKVSGSTTVKLKVKGTIPRSNWDRLRKDIKRKFHLKV